MEFVDYWTKEFRIKMGNSKNFEAVAFTSIEVIETMPKPVKGISLPITTGGYGLENNLKVIEACVRELFFSFGYNVFNIAPLELGIRPLKEQWKNAGNIGYCEPIIDIIYRKIFESMLLEEILRAPNYESSYGAKREKPILSELNITVSKIPKKIWNKVLSDLGLNQNSKVVLI